jgi:hypothetical protein
MHKMPQKLEKKKKKWILIKDHRYLPARSPRTRLERKETFQKGFDHDKSWHMYTQRIET